MDNTKARNEFKGLRVLESMARKAGIVVNEQIVSKRMALIAQIREDRFLKMPVGKALSARLIVRTTEANHNINEITVHSEEEIAAAETRANETLAELRKAQHRMGNMRKAIKKLRMKKSKKTGFLNQEV